MIFRCDWKPGSVLYILLYMYVVCVTGGYLMSYWNRPFFPEFCSDSTLDDPVTYDTMVRIAGSWAGVAHVFKAVADHYGWTHIVLLSDDETTKICWYGAKPFGEVFGNNENYTFTWLRLGSQPTDEQLDYILQQIRARTRGPLIMLFHFYRTRCIACKCGMCYDNYVPPCVYNILELFHTIELFITVLMPHFEVKFHIL